MAPYLDGLLDNLDRRFQNLGIIGAFHVLGPKVLSEDDTVVTKDLKILSRKFPPQQPETTVLQEWASYKQHLTGTFRGNIQVQMCKRVHKYKIINV